MQSRLINLLLVPSGHVARSPYWLGVVILTLSGVVLGLLPVLGSWLALALLWPWFCLLTKRCRDLGRSPPTAAFALVPLATSNVIAAVLGLIMVSPGTTMAMLPLAGLLGTVALLAALAGLAAVIWFGVVPGRQTLMG